MLRVAEKLTQAQEGDGGVQTSWLATIWGLRTAPGAIRANANIIIRDLMNLLVAFLARLKCRPIRFANYE